MNCICATMFRLQNRPVSLVSFVYTTEVSPEKTPEKFGEPDDDFHFQRTFIEVICTK